MEDATFLYVAGTAGSGKTKFTAGFHRWLYDQRIDSITLNLDPGAESLPYTPDIDIRDWVQLGDVMERYGLGPNGAQIVAADLITLQLGDIMEAIESFSTPYVIVDTPGQTELFVFRDSGRILMDTLAPGRSMLAFLIDPFLAKRPSAFVSQLMLSATTQFRFGVPMLNVLPKSDLLKPEELAKIRRWGESADALEDDLTNERADLWNQMSTDVFRVLDAMGSYANLTPVSSETLDGMDDVYAFAQGTFKGGDDDESGRESSQSPRETPE